MATTGWRTPLEPRYDLLVHREDRYSRYVRLMKRVLPAAATARVACEAACGFGWERWIGTRGVFVGMKGFGASGPAPALYKHFGITPEGVAAAAKTSLAAS